MPKIARVAALLLLAPLAAGAQVNPVVPSPKALLYPNYDNILVGKNQALEGGAYIARVNDASSNFYNPAGLAAAERTSLSASSTGYVWTKLSSTASDASGGSSFTTSKIEGVPGYFGVVLEPPFVDTRAWRIGFSITRSVSFSPGGLDQQIGGASGTPFDRLTFSTESNFGTQVYQLAVAWAPIPSFRLGLSGGLATTTFGSKVTLSGGISALGTAGQGQFLSTLRANGTDNSILFGIGAQWDVVAGLTIGALVRPPGIRMGGSSTVTHESMTLLPDGSSTSAYFRDEGGDFQYKLPLEMSIGVAYRFGALELEFDLRYHDPISPYDFYRSNVPYQTLTQTAGAAPVAGTQTAPVITYTAKRTWNGAFGANYHLGERLTLHAGFYNSQSPVADAASAFRKADLYGFTGGVDFQFEKFGASLGAGYQFGTSEATSLTLGNTVLSANEIKLQSISIIYAISYQF